MSKIDLSIQKDILAKNVEKARENNVIIPTIAQMQNPESIPAPSRKVRAWPVGVNPQPLRITWKNEPRSPAACSRPAQYVEIPQASPASPAASSPWRQWFPHRLHKVGRKTSAACSPVWSQPSLTPPGTRRWPSTANYCRGPRNPSCWPARAWRFCPPRLSRRFSWLKSIAGEVIANTGCREQT